MPQLQAVNLLEQCLRRRRTTQEILHQGSGVTLRAVSQQLFGEPAIPAGISRIESTQGFGDVLPHLGSKDGPQAVGISNAPRKRTKSAMTRPRLARGRNSGIGQRPVEVFGKTEPRP